ncbi:S-adenosyl-L-methionine-dependent methyltransferase [Hypoxylon sp. FL1857]|nr:S-adenosyl-L-methionine-dependent methyltransferase [Hypoxylon sp. FL1857]
MSPDFEKQSYWHERFKSETLFEWLESSEFFWTLIEPVLSKLPRKEHPPRILQLGSGTSDLHTYFRRNGYLDVTNVDYEPLAIERGRQMEEACFGDVRMKYMVADVTQLDNDLRENHKFDAVVDKSTVDAVSCGGNTPFLRMASGVRKYLVEGGIWVSLSYSSSRFNVEGLPFDVEILHKIPTPKLSEFDPVIYHYCYLLRPRRLGTSRVTMV